VILIEAEARPGHHSTGRSAAMFIETYGNAPVRALTRASRAHFFSPPPGFCEVPLVRPRPWVIAARADQAQSLAREAAENAGALEPLTAEEVRALVPVIRPGAVDAGLIDRSAADIDVDALHQGWLRAFRAAGGTLVTDARLDRLDPEAGGWRARAGGHEIACAVVVDAAGAWADQVAEIAGLGPIGLQPKRRTAALIDLPAGLDASAWPVVADADEAFYFKPDAGRLLLSPADETDVEAHDAFPDEIALAEAAQGLATMTTIEVTRRPRAWAGLRTFAPDRTPVVGFARDAAAPFFWLAGQGGYGIQTAPAMASLAAALAGGQARPSFADEGLIAALSPDRFG
jgi:D-arginine dehydrogenase